VRGRRLHFVGIGGAGMSGLALVCHELGATVSGSDRADSSYMERLREAGLAPVVGHDAANLPEGAEVVVSTAIGADNPELRLAAERGVEPIHRGKLLAELCATKRLIAVAGTHGKTTTAAMVVWALRALGADPAFFVGGEVTGLGPGGDAVNAGWGEGEWVVAEADESDGSFRELTPEVAVVTNVEMDHHAHWGSLAELRDAFERFLEPARAVALPGGGAEVPGPGRGAEARGPGRGAEARGPGRGAEMRGPGGGGEAPGPGRGRGAAGPGRGAEAPGLSRGGAAAGAAERGPAAPPQARAVRFDADGPGPADLPLAVPGRHNLLNARAALAGVALTLGGGARAGGVDRAAERDRDGEPDRDGELARAAAALAEFPGVRRRLELKGERDGARVYDDYGHHPTEVRAALAALRELEPSRLLAVFQPHLYSRTRAFLEQFGAALALADEVVVLDVYPAREEPVGELAGVSGLDVARAAADRAGGRRVLWTPTLDAAGAAVAPRLAPGGIVVTIGAGDVFRVADALVGDGGSR
jgi:UDP-N-acetylmuramate--alanine ligase